jgi:hypothetical protein
MMGERNCAHNTSERLPGSSRGGGLSDRPGASESNGLVHLRRVSLSTLHPMREG